MNSLLLYIIVFICGGSVLAIEILGTRIIGPFYGVSLYLWSALISITLIALSVGYMLGGRLADRTKNVNVLSLIILLPGLFLFLIPFIRNSVIGAADSFGLRTAVLLSSFILFFPPLTLLGMVSPYAVKLRTETLDKVGTRAGDLYAISTIGSVIAALLTGFLLIPNIGVIKLTFSIGAVLVITALLTFISGKKAAVKAAAVVFILLFISALYFLFPGEKADISRGVIEVRQSTYGELRVMDIGNERLLLIDGGIHSAVNRRTYENILPYGWVVELVKDMRDIKGDMLLIGLGGGVLLKSFYEDNWDVEAVEIDPEVTDLAYKYFELNTPRSAVFHQDGRAFLKNGEKKYDLILMDAFGSSSVPFHLVTVEAFSLIKQRLHEEGILALNLEAFGWDDKIVISVSATLKQVFANVMVFPIAEPPNTLGNVIIAASDGPTELLSEPDRDYEDPDYRFSANYERAHAWDNRFLPDTKGAIILTDDLNPVDIWSERINVEARKKLHIYPGPDSFLW
jgi:predicted membrane-bound spermidine synthase